jgi:ribosome recycling factor
MAATIADVQRDAEEHMKKAIANLQREYHSIRTGRANPAILDRVEVDYYGTPTPLKNLANISVQEGRTLIIQPYDKSVLKGIEKGIHEAELGLNASSDGTVCRIVIPPLTEERRKEMTKVVKKIGEESKVAIRNSRRHALEELKKLKSTQVSEDEIKRQEEVLQKMTDKYVKEIDTMISSKEAEVMEV